ncbi:MAG: glucuronate isomerase [Anaerolineae bacterium]|nr:glucuronate isomerase [Anaerolineae bacterium]
MSKIVLPADRYFGPDAAQKKVAQQLYAIVQDLPLICPHGHVDPRMFADEHYDFGTPTDLLIIPDHYVFRMLYSQGVPLESLGVPRWDGGATETDHRKIWQAFADNYYLFRGTPSGQWLAYELKVVFGVEDKLNGENAQAVYDHITECLTKPEYRPRQMFEDFNIEVLCTTDAATDSLEYHQQICDSGWCGVVRPTFRPDAVVNMDTEGWRENIDALSAASGIDVVDYKSFIAALEDRRTYFKEMAATATDHAVLTPYTEELPEGEANAIFTRALRGDVTEKEIKRFTGHMLLEMARMSIEDGLVMQVHAGSYRNHNQSVFAKFGRDKGSDIPIPSEFTRNLQPLLAKYGNDPRLTLILFTLDETTYARELAPLAGHYPALRLGPPWWFHDSINGIARYFDQVIETAGLYNTVGFNDDTRAFPSIPARHDLWRRAASNWIAGLVVRGMVDEEDAAAMVEDASYRLAKSAYKLG